MQNDNEIGLAPHRRPIGYCDFCPFANQRLFHLICGRLAVLFPTIALLMVVGDVGILWCLVQGSKSRNFHENLCRHCATLKYDPLRQLILSFSSKMHRIVHIRDPRKRDFPA